MHFEWLFGGFWMVLMHFECLFDGFRMDFDRFWMDFGWILDGCLILLGWILNGCLMDFG